MKNSWIAFNRLHMQSPPAESPGLAMAAPTKVKLTYKDIRPPLLTAEEAIAQKLFYDTFLTATTVGDVEGKVD